MKDIPVKPRGRVLVVDDEDTIRGSVGYLLEKAGYEVLLASRGQDALEIVTSEQPQVMLLDLRMPEMSGMEVLERAMVLVPELAIVIMTAHGTIKNAVEALQSGGFDFMTKPFKKEQLLGTVDKAMRYHLLVHENRSLRRMVSQQYRFENLIAFSKSMKKTLERAMLAASTPSNILLLGESGTGKSLLARTIHMNSRVSEGPFHAINIAAIPGNFFESELFGHKKGSFTGALENRRGALEAAAQGTLLMDEIGELTNEAQVKLLQVLQERQYRRLGEDTVRPLRARIVAATNRNLKEEVEAGNFREDLYYRLCVVPLELPALRQRREDIPGLVAHFLERAARDLERSLPVLSNEALTALCRYDFPGNIRELANIMERLVALAPGSKIEVEDLGLPMCESSLAELVFDNSPHGIDLPSFERDLIETALKRTRGNQSQAARQLGITRSALIYRMEKYKLKP